MINNGDYILLKASIDILPSFSVEIQFGRPNINCSIQQSLDYQLALYTNNMYVVCSMFYITYNSDYDNVL